MINICTVLDIQRYIYLVLIKKVISIYAMRFFNVRPEKNVEENWHVIIRVYTLGIKAIGVYAFIHIIRNIMGVHTQGHLSDAQFIG